MSCNWYCFGIIIVVGISVGELVVSFADGIVVGIFICIVVLIVVIVVVVCYSSF